MEFDTLRQLTLAAKDLDAVFEGTRMVAMANHSGVVTLLLEAARNNETRLLAVIPNILESGTAITDDQNEALAEAIKALNVVVKINNYVHPT
jgi:hypothetical protein